MAKRSRDGDGKDEESTPPETPSGRKSILRGTPNKLNGIATVDATPKSLRKVLFSTPAKHGEDDEDDDNVTPTTTRNDRSARRKSQRTLQHVDEASDGENAIVQDGRLAQQILGEDAVSEDEDEDDDDEDGITPSEPQSGPDTPSKSGKLRGRPKGRRRERTPSPPPDLPPHELYFFQNRTGANKTSTNTLPSHVLLSHEDYFAKIGSYKDPHASDIDRLKRLHKRAFEQWMFELEEGFNLCLYGYGSKRLLVNEFAEELSAEAQDKRKIVVVNGYTPGLAMKDILNTLARVVIKSKLKLPTQVPALLDEILRSLTTDANAMSFTLVVHSLDHQNLRKPAVQAMLARLAGHPAISLIATCDSPLFPLLWDTATTRQYRFLYHDTTTFEPYRVELDVVEEVNTLLGRSRRRVGGKDGVAFVLKSLPENARNLFRILVAEQLALADAAPAGLSSHAAFGGGQDDDDDEEVLGASDDDLAAAGQHTPSRRGRHKRAPVKSAKKVAAPVVRPNAAQGMEGVEYRTLYHKAVEEFVCSSELNFRTLLKEFVDHQIIESRKDVAGTERVAVTGVGREELEGLLEELV
ncbi:Origin recognition complex subunit 2 [Recurvomyces mirabilis]|uniref:Origin recognition complex subunit 2 n=1 Tax=Recurvomyces mirabilis TaxID=574656 RepID=A0AAE0WQW9_9PEZI|nr:Origin recognition complex subunit 2 [Recurvomyces mirabilis]KAK5154743.1 Origin recognition complex subunit 2 [Recurvomyces mirabilis]